MTQNTKNTEQAPAKPSMKDFSVTLGFSSLMTALTALVGCVVVAFMMGVIVGRDDTARPTLAQIVAEKEAAKAAEQADAQADTQGSGSASGQQSDQDAGQVLSPLEPARAHKTVMSAEELRYATELKGKVAGAAKAPSKPTAGAKPEATQNAAAQSTPSSTTAPTGASTTPANVTTTATTTSSGTQAPSASNATALYDYVYQVASLKSEESVDVLRAQLEGEGLRTRMVKSGDYLMVQVLMRGTTQQAKALQDLMVQLKLGAPVQQQKKAVE